VLALATARTEELAAMGSLELHAAVAAGASQAGALIRYHERLFQLNQALMFAYMQVRDLRAEQGLPPSVGKCPQIPPDFGPTPYPPPGSNMLTGRESTWVRLLGSLNARDHSQVAACLEELGGWIFQ
jgi:hypothetical protein